MEPEQKNFKKKWGPAEGKKLYRRLKEFSAPPPVSVWQKAVSKNPEERQDGRDGLSLLFVLFEDTLALKADHDGDPLEDLDILLKKGTPKFVTLNEFATPKLVSRNKPAAVVPLFQHPGATPGARANAP